MFGHRLIDAICTRQAAHVSARRIHARSPLRGLMQWVSHTSGARTGGGGERWHDKAGGGRPAHVHPPFKHMHRRSVWRLYIRGMSGAGTGG